MIIEELPENAARIVREWRRDGKTICLVPTMGYFHEGHLSLMKHGLQLADKVIVSLFVNPTQFGANEDLSVYPQDLEGDCHKAERTGVDLLFCPAASAVYREKHQTVVSVKDVSNRLCGLNRPGHFDGVATIVTKLFNMFSPEFALFGEKDYQQLVVIKTMVSDLDMPVTVKSVPTIREHDGLAMSSRNSYLDPEERAIAPVLYETLNDIRTSFKTKKTPAAVLPLVEKAKAKITRFTQCSVDYLEVFDERDLSPAEVISENCRAAGAIRINGKVRLIDNLSMK